MNELKVTQSLGSISFNYEDLKAEIQAMANQYSNLVYTDDVIAEAKADRAKLNKLKTILNDERKKREKEFLMPFQTFKSNVNDLISIIDTPIEIIDKQIKEVEAKREAEKYDTIKEYFESKSRPEWLGLRQIWNDKWLNSTVTLKSIYKAIDERLEQIERDLNTLALLPDFAFEAKETYKYTLDITKSIEEGQRLADIQKRKEEAHATNAQNDHTGEVKEKAENYIPNFESVTDLLIQCPSDKVNQIIVFLENEGCKVKEVRE